MRRQIWSLALCLMLLALCACGGNSAAPAEDARLAQAEARDASVTDAVEERVELGPTPASMRRRRSLKKMRRSPPAAPWPGSTWSGTRRS